MSTTKANTSTCTTKKKCKRSEVWKCFLEHRGRGAILMDSAEGWSFVCVPAEDQPEFGELETREASGSEPPFVGGWVGFKEYGDKEWWKYCLEVYAFEVEEEDAFEGPSFELSDFGPKMSVEEYEGKIKKIRELLWDGEVYQVCFTHPFEGDFKGDPFGLYVELFMKNPSAMCFYAEEDDWAVVSNSPERLVSLRGGRLRSEPVKGTVARGEDPEFLLKDEKTYAELTMIVDLLRNDLGKVARLGTVNVKEHQSLMELENVWHSYSVIEAELADGKGLMDVLDAVFPGGSITGCPKIRAMEYIAELEDYERGVYCGSAGYISLNGNADFNIMIRTGRVQNGKLVFPSGGGIVMDSDASAEYQETLDKVGVIKSLST